jgi:hypothetical protein
MRNALLLLLLPLQLFALPALVAHTAKGATSSGSSSGFTTSAINTTGSTLECIFVNHSDSSTFTHITPTDSLTNTWVSVDTVDYGSNIRDELFCATNPITGAAQTFSVVAVSTTTQLGIAVATFSGVNAFDVKAGVNNWISHGTTWQGGSVTPSAVNSLVISIAGVQSGQADVVSINSGFTVTDILSNSSFINSIGLAYLAETSIVAKNPTWTRSTGNGSGSIENFVFNQAAPTYVPNFVITLGP